MSHAGLQSPVILRITAMALSALAFSIPCASARADELKLKDGTKIIGTIVGFEENSFKVKTNYGFAVVQRDQIISIFVSDPAKAAPATAKVAPSDLPKKTISASATPALTPKPVAAKAAVPNPASTLVHKTASAVDPKNSASPTLAAVSAPTPPPQPPQPEPVREEVTGNTYANLTYGFQMYKPPDWEMLADVRATLPGTIAAMGTEDQTTYLLIGQNAVGKSLDAGVEATDHRLREIFDNYRPLDDTRITIAGAPAIKLRFRGSIDDHDWSGMVVLVLRSAHLYTILGMTQADSDLVQIQENVITRTISSLQFTK